MQALTCVIVDDEIYNTDLLAYFATQIPYLKLIMVFQEPNEALTYLLKNPTDLLITDINMPLLTGIGLYEGIATQTNTQVVFITGYVDSMLEAVQYPAVDYLLKPISFQRFEYATKKAWRLAQADANMYGEISPEILAEMLKNFPKLSNAEIGVLKLIANGLTTIKIADTLNICPGTVEVHRNSIRKKLKLPISQKLSIIAQYLVEKLNIKVSDENL
jgi:DNA-binding NarL/FixJ family response regulator